MSLLESIRSFSKSELKNVRTRVTTVDGRTQVFEGDTVSRNEAGGVGYVVDLKPDLQVGQVLPFLSFGSQDVANDVSLLRKHRITRILNVAATGTAITDSHDDDDDDEFVSKQVDMLDVPEMNARRLFDECFDFIDACRPHDDRHGDGRDHVFVHCNAGVSRSATVVIAYLMSRRRMRFDDALQLARIARPAARPNDGFMRQLRDYDGELRLHDVDKDR